MNNNKSQAGHHGASNNRGQKQHRESPFAAFAVLQTILLCLAATSSCTSSLHIDSTFRYASPADGQPQRKQRPATQGVFEGTPSELRSQASE